jgi:N-acylneuraminate cytidylyltransferase/CMP-N,N'-diacetyllegionaminic acid synthase
MFENRRILAIVPARGGSKRLPGKNTRMLAGKALIAWTLEAAQQSRYIDRIIVSTDSDRIKQAAIDAGAEVPFMRPQELASDQASGMDVYQHAISWAQEKDCFDLVMILQPTSPLRNTEDIDRAIETLHARKARAIVSVCAAEHHPLWCNILPQDGSMVDFLRPEVLNKNSQELPHYYRLNGAIYLIEIDELQKSSSFYGPATFAYIMPNERSVDIDTLEDFFMAESLLRTDR